MIFGLVSSLFVAMIGDTHAVHVSEVQPIKLAAMESHWETNNRSPMYLLLFPDEKNERNMFEIGKIPGLLSLLAYHNINAEVKGLRDFPKKDIPPVLPVFLSFRIMVALGTLFIILTIIGLFKRNRLLESPIYLKAMVCAIPLPYIALETGWIVAEVGRQPWIVYNLMRTSDAASTLAGSQVLISLIAFIVIYGFLGAVGFYLIFKNAKQGPKLAS